MAKVLGVPVFVAGLVVSAAAAQGCAIQSNDSSRFREPIPLGTDVALAIPGSPSGTTGGKTAAGIHLASNPVPAGGYATWYQFTRDVADGVDLGTAVILGAIWFTVHSPPTSVTAHSAVWGPGAGSALDPVVWRLTVNETGDREYDYELDARPKGSSSESDYKAVLKGHGFGMSRPEHRMGSFVIDNDAYASLDPSRASKDSGTLKVTFDVRTFPATIEADVHHTADPGFYDVTVTHQRDGSGEVDIHSLGDVEVIKDGRLENVVLHSRWNATGAGRADMQITGGDMTSTVKGSECWGIAFSRTYYSDSVNFQPAEGDPSACVFALSSF